MKTKIYSFIFPQRLQSSAEYCSRQKVSTINLMGRPRRRGVATPLTAVPNALP